MTELIEDIARFVPLLGTIVAVVAMLAVINWCLRRR